MVDKQNVYGKLNDVEVVSIKLMSDQGGSTDIQDLCMSLNIYEDIFSPCLSGYIYISDSINLIDHFPIVGQETVELQFRTPGIGSEIVVVVFEVYSMSDRIRSKNDKSEVYRLNLISQNYRGQELQRISRSFSGTISDIAKTVFEDYFNKDTNYRIQKTHGDYKFVIPSLTPVETLKYLTTTAISKNVPRDSSYVMYESLDNFKFVSLNYLLSGKVLRKYVIKPTGIRDGTKDLLDQMMNVQDFEYEKGFNRIEDMKRNKYSSTLIQHDLISKKWQKQYYIYGKDFKKRSHANSNKTLPSSNRYDGIVGNNVMVRSTHNGMHTSHPITQDYENWLQSRIANLGMVGFNKLKIRVAGDSRLRAGMMVNIDIPANEPVEANDSEYLKIMDSGRYMVSSVRHIINLGSERDYTCVVELSRDSYPVQVPDESTFLGSGKNDPNGENGVFKG